MKKVITAKMQCTFFQVSTIIFENIRRTMVTSRWIKPVVFVMFLVHAIRRTTYNILTELAKVIDRLWVSSMRSGCRRFR